MGDEDFRKIYYLLQEETKGLLPRSFIVTLDENAQEKLDSIKMNAAPIITDASYFVEMMKKELIKEKLMLPDSNYDGIPYELIRVEVEHEKLSKLSLIEHPNAIYSLLYQDGLIHAFSRILSTMKSGQNSDVNRIFNVINSYEQIIKGCLSAGNYPDVAYYTGYQSGVICLLDIEGRSSLPMYYLFRCGDILSYEQFEDYEKDAHNLHKSATKLAKKMIKRIGSDHLVFHRRPFM